jgi:hypothetical protein
MSEAVSLPVFVGGIQVERQHDARTLRPAYSTIYFPPRRQSSQKVLGLVDGCNTMLRQSFFT